MSNGNNPQHAVSLRRAVRNAVSELPGGFVTAAAHLSLRQQDLRNRLAESQKTSHHVNLRHFEEIIDLTGDERIAQSVAALCNGVFLPCPAFSDLPDDGVILDDMLSVMESVGRYGRSLRESLDDGDIDDGEWHQLSMAAQEIFRAVHLIQARAELYRSVSDDG